MTMRKREVPFTALGGVFSQEDIDAVVKVVRGAAGEGGNFFPLPEETDFQTAFAKHEGAGYAVATNSAGTALDACMRGLGIGPGDEVITTALSFVCTAGSPAALGAKIVFADVSPQSLNLDPAKVEEKITKATKAIIPVHFAGLSADLDAFARISRDYDIPIIYDAAHAVGTKYRGRPIGPAGMASCYSFQSNKNMTCLGEGGMITTDDPDFAERVRRTKTFGYVYGGPELRVVSLGFNYRLTKVQCAAGLSQLERVDQVIQARLDRMTRMNELLEGIEELILPEGIDEEHGCHLFVVRLDTNRVTFDRDEFRKHLLKAHGIGTAVHYPIIWEWEAFHDVEYDSTDCSVAEKASRQVVSLPIFPTTDFETLEYVAWAIKETISELKGSSLQV